ncbi:hypothetical protein BH708_03990 [Brachybacterium sp. P6-10-X1]|nr:hypothetical protein BH708_03990 [Brachybacterium sp. P6-10-X1]
MLLHENRTYVVTGADKSVGALTAQTLEAQRGRVVRCGIDEDVGISAQRSAQQLLADRPDQGHLRVSVRAPLLASATSGVVMDDF